MSRDQLADDADIDADYLVVHNEDGQPCHPEDSFPRHGQYDELGSPQDFREGVFEYIDSMAGAMAPMFYEPVGCVNDDRLLDLYRMEAKRAAVAGSSESIEAKANRMRTYIEARGLPVPDVSEWYYVYATREEVTELAETYPEMSAFSQPSDRTTDEGDELRHVRFTGNELALIEDIVGREPVALDEPMTAEEAREQ